MTDDLRRIFEDDQHDEHRREARRFAEALAGDVIAYRDALSGAGIKDELLDTLVVQFNASWLGGMDSNDAGVTFVLGGTDE